MKTTQVTLTDGQQYDLGFDFAVICDYEELFGEEFTTRLLTKQTTQLRVIYAAVHAFNEGVPEWRQFRHLSVEDVVTLSNAIAPHLNSFYHIPADTPAGEDDGNP